MLVRGWGDRPPQLQCPSLDSSEVMIARTKPLLVTNQSRLSQMNTVL